MSTRARILDLLGTLRAPAVQIVGVKVADDAQALAMYRDLGNLHDVLVARPCGSVGDALAYLRGLDGDERVPHGIIDLDAVWIGTAWLPLTLTTATPASLIDALASSEVVTQLDATVRDETAVLRGTPTDRGEFAASLRRS